MTNQHLTSGEKMRHIKYQIDLVGIMLFAPTITFLFLSNVN